MGRVTGGISVHEGGNSESNDALLYMREDRKPENTRNEIKGEREAVA
jgi:hypothetical protein